MRILGVVQIKGRGTVAVVTLDCDPPKFKAIIVRRSDGAQWRSGGIGYHAHRSPRAGDTVDLLLLDGPPFSEGDEICVGTEG